MEPGCGHPPGFGGKLRYQLKQTDTAEPSADKEQKDRPLRGLATTAREQDPMQLTKYTDFALRTLIFLNAQEPGSRVTITQVAEHFDIPRNHLIKIVHHLAQEGYIDTVRGKGGGIRLGRPAKEINLRYLIEITEETLEPINCLRPPCPIAGHCELKPILHRAQEAFMEVLEGYSLADIRPDSNLLLGLLNWNPEDARFQA